MSQQYSWPTHSWPLEGRCLYYALLGLTQAPGFAGGPDFQPEGGNHENQSLLPTTGCANVCPSYRTESLTRIFDRKMYGTTGCNKT